MSTALMESEYEYAEISCWALEFGRCVAFWSGEGWDVVAAAYSIAGIANSSNSQGLAVLRRKRREGLPVAPGFTRWHGERIRTERSVGGSWGAYRINAARDVVAKTYREPTEEAALESLAKLALNDDEVALVNGGRAGEAHCAAKTRLCTSFRDASNLVREYLPDYDFDPVALMMTGQKAQKEAAEADAPRGATL